MGDRSKIEADRAWVVWAWEHPDRFIKPPKFLLPNCWCGSSGVWALARKFRTDHYCENHVPYDADMLDRSPPLVDSYTIFAEDFNPASVKRGLPLIEAFRELLFRVGAKAEFRQRRDGVHLIINQLVPSTITPRGGPSPRGVSTKPDQKEAMRELMLRSVLGGTAAHDEMCVRGLPDAEYDDHLARIIGALHGNALARAELWPREQRVLDENWGQMKAALIGPHGLSPVTAFDQDADDIAAGEMNNVP